MPRTPIARLLQDATAAAAEAALRHKPAEAILETRAARPRGALSRRRFLGRMSVLAGAGLGVGPLGTGPARAGTRPSPRVAIVGAGLAGLTCAYRLGQSGVAATLFEANTRLGGRCWTRRGEFAEGQLAEHGGELIDQGHLEIRQLIQELGLGTENLLQAEANGTEAFYHFDGVPYSVAEATDDLKQIWQRMHRDLSEASYPTLYNNFTERGRQLDQMSVIDWIEATVPGGLQSRLGQLLDVAYNIEYGAESSEQSALNLLYLLGYSGPGRLRLFGHSNEKYRITGGNDQLPQRLAAALPGPIVTGTSMVAVRRTSAGAYQLTFETGRRSSTITADKVVLALPFSVLRSSVDLTRAAFGARKLTAIREQGMGTNTKLLVQFHDRHWEPLGANGETFADTGYQCTWDVTRAQPGTAGILVNYTGGLIGASFGSGTPSARAATFLTQVESVLPGLSSRWNGRAAIDYWAGNRFTLGSYSYWRVGQYLRFAGVEREQEGNCHFAGEHTSVDSQGYLNGAVESGQRAANEILRDLGRR